MEELLNGKYHIRAELGRGGMGTVYLATHDSLHRDDALKILHPDLSVDREFVERFISEARSMACLDHDNIVGIYDIFEHAGLYCIAMEYFNGISLRTWIQDKHPLTLKQILSIITQTAKGLGYAHAHGIVHRDIKPGNILINHQMEVKIVDFGVAAAMSETKLTLNGEIVGSPRYMPQEQARGESIDQRSDLYSLGIVFYQLLTGSPPYDGNIEPDSNAELIGKLASRTEELTLQFPNHIPKNIQGLVRRLLYRDPKKRVKDAATLLCELGVITSTMTVASASANADELMADCVEKTWIIPSDCGKKMVSVDVPKKRARFSIIQHSQYIIASLLVGFLFASGMLFFVFEYGKSTTTASTVNQHLNTVTLRNDVQELQKRLVNVSNSAYSKLGKFEDVSSKGDNLVLFQKVMDEYRNASNIMLDGINRATEQDYSSAKKMLLLAESKFTDAESQSINAYNAYLNNRAVIDIEKILDETLLLQQEALEKKQQAELAGAKQIKTNEYVRGNYFQDKADELFIQSKDLLRQYDLVNYSKKINAAATAYEKSLQYFTLAKNISVKNIALKKIKKREDQLRLLQLQFNIAQIGNERHRTDKVNLPDYKKANEMRKNFNRSLKQFIALDASKDLEYFNGRLIELLIMAKETKLAYQRISRSVANEGMQTIQLPTSKPPRTLLTAMGINARSPETKKVERIILDLVQALQSKDMDKLKIVADISESRLATLQQIFTSYPRLAVSVKNYSLVENTAAVELRLTTQGEEIIPDNSWRNTKLVAQKKTRGWEKFTWN